MKIQKTRVDKAPRSLIYSMKTMMETIGPYFCFQRAGGRWKPAAGYGSASLRSASRIE